MTRYVASVDQGTTSTRFMIFDDAGAVVGSHQLEHTQIYPQAGWVEHDPLEIWARTQDVIEGGLAKADLTAERPGRDRHHQPARDRGGLEPAHRPAVLQRHRLAGHPHGPDLQRAGQGPVLSGVEGGGQDRFRAQTGLPLATYFSGPKIKWILDNVPGVRAAAERGEAVFGNIDTWVIWNLTGGPSGGAHVTDVTNASRTLLMNLHTLDWDDEILGILDIPRRMLPAIRPSSDPEIYGYALGKVPVCGDLGDQQAALVGQTCFGVGEAKNTYGTGCFMLLNTGPLAVPEQTRPADDRGLQAGQRTGGLRARRLDCDHRRAGAMAARQPGLF